MNNFSEYRDNMLKAVNQAAALLLAVDNNKDIDDLIITSLEIVGCSVDADRVHLWRNELLDGKFQFVHMYTWLSKTGEQKVIVPDGVMTPYKKRHEWESKFFQDEYVGGPISNLSKDEQEYFKAFDIKTVFLIPLYLNKELWGLFSIDDCTKERDFTQDEIYILKTVSLMMVSAINRNSLIVKINSENERLMLMLDTSPICTQIWDRNLNTIDCNEAGVRLYGFKNKQEYRERFIESCSPEYQPDGQRSDEKAVRLVNEAFNDGYRIFDWMHQLPDGSELIPAEVSLVRARYGDQDVVLGYTRDLREHNKMMESINYRDKLTHSVNLMAGWLLNSAVDSFEQILVQSMKLIAETAGIDCVYLWKNHRTGGKLFCCQLFEWSWEKTMFADGTPYSYPDFDTFFAEES